MELTHIPAASPLSGWYADRGGTIVSTAICLVCALPFWVLIFIHVDLAYFLAMYALLSTYPYQYANGLYGSDSSLQTTRPVRDRNHLTRHGRVCRRNAESRRRRV